jgi:hypothetical protein
VNRRSSIAYGIVVRLAEQSATPEFAAPAELPKPGPASAFEHVEHRVTDVSGATKLFTELLDAEPRLNTDFSAAELSRATDLAKRLGTSVHLRAN